MSPRHPGQALWVVALGLSCLTSIAKGDAPRIDSISPHGLQRGKVGELSVSGANLSGTPTLIAPFPVSIEKAPAPNKEGGRWTLKARVDPGTPIGVYPVRVRTADGISNPYLFSVGQLPQVEEKEDNNTFVSAQAIPALAVVEGQASGNDVDYFRFPGKKGQRVVVDAQCARIGSGLDPSIRLTTARHKFVASADDTAGLLSDARLTATLPEDADYVIELSDSRYQGGRNPFYRLVVGVVPVADEIYPLGGRKGETVGFELRGGTLAQLARAAATVQGSPGSETFEPMLSTREVIDPASAGFDLESVPRLAVSDYPEFREPTDPTSPPSRMIPPLVINGRIEAKGDQDRFTIVTNPGQKYHVQVVAADLGSALDGVLQVRTARDNLIATADDTTSAAVTKGAAANRRNQVIASADPSIDFTAPAGSTEVTLLLRDLKGEGGIGFPYRIIVEPTFDSFDLTLGDTEVSLPKGGTVVVPISVTRKGFNGPITVTVAEPPRA